MKITAGCSHYFDVSMKGISKYIMIIDEIKNRRSIRKYKPDKIEKNDLYEILSAAGLAPSGTNKQPWKFIIYEGQNKDRFVEKMRSGIMREKSGNSRLPNSAWAIEDAQRTAEIMDNAPVVIAVLNMFGRSFFDNLSADERVTESVDLLSIGAAVQNMLLQAEKMKIGSLWIANTCFAYGELTEFIKKEIKIQEDFQLACAVALGYADENPQKRQRKPLESIIEELK